MENFRDVSLLFLALLCGQAASQGLSEYELQYCEPGAYGNGGYFIVGDYTCHSGNICRGGASICCAPPAKTAPSSLGSSYNGGMGACLPNGYKCCGGSVYCTGANCCQTAGRRK